MAYNPFNIFRRNQKALFAVLTVFVMVVFTLSSGVAGGDFFETVSRWLGSKAGGEAVCKIDGDTISTNDLEGPNGAQFKRVMANRFMALAAEQTVRGLEVSITEQMPRLSSDGQATAQQALGILRASRAGQLPPEVIFQLPLLANSLSAQIESPNTRSEHKQVLRDAQSLYLLIHKLAMGGNGHYFMNAPNRHRRDLIDFLLWQKKAEQLGIEFSRDDVNKMIHAEFNNAFSARAEVEVRKAMQQSQGFTMELCLDALAVEFAVRAAQTALLGHAGRFGQAAVYPTPYETFEYYREQCSPATYQVIAVPAAGFVDSVTGEPSESELRELFRNGENLEPDPKSETPGFKEPRKISVGWLGITGKEPYYLKLAEEQIKVGEVMARASGLLTTPLPGATATWAAGAVAPMTVKEPAVDAAYNGYVARFNGIMRNEYSSPQLFTRDILESSVIRPGVLAAALGGVVGQTAGFGSPASAAAVAMTAPIAYEIRDRVKVGMPLVLGAVPGPGMLQTAITGAAASAASQPKPLPIDYMRPELLKTAVEERARVIAFGGRPDFRDPQQTRPVEKGDVDRFIEELKNMTEDGRPKDKAAAEKYIQDFIASRGLKHFGKSTQPRDEWTLEDDPGLLPLVGAQKESLRQARSFHGGEYMPFGQSFFWTSEPDPTSFLRTRRGPATSGLYQAQVYPPQAGEPREGEPRYVVWRTEDIDPKKELNLETARTSGALKAAWKRVQARKLAAAHANMIAEQIRAYDKTNEFAVSDFLRDKLAELEAGMKDNPKALKRAELFRIDNVAPLVPGFSPRFRQELMPFELRESENIPYPTPEMRTALLENRDKPPKTAFVMVDAPKDTYYVTTLMRRDLKTADDFRVNVFSRLGNAQDIRDRHYAEVMNKARQTAMDLLKQEFKYEETEEQKKKLDDNLKAGGRD